jgi:Tol biopolymer transport system component
MAALTAIATVAVQSSAASPAAQIARIAAPGTDPNGPSASPSLSGNGQFIAFVTRASNLGPPDPNGQTDDVYLFDRGTQQATLVSIGKGGDGANAPSSAPSISGDGSTVAFASRASNLVPGGGDHHLNIFLRTADGTVFQVTRTPSGDPPDGDSSQPVMSANGRYVAFTSTADNLVSGDHNKKADVFVVSLVTDKIRRVSVSSSGREANRASSNPAISASGRYISFDSAATNLVGHDTNHAPDVFVRDMVTGSVRRASVSSRGQPQNAAVAPPFSQISAISANGRYVAFDSDATNLVPGDHNGHTDVFRHDMRSGRTVLVSRGSSGTEGDNDSFAPSMSADGSVVTFDSYASNLAQPWAPIVNVFVRDINHGTTLIADVAQDGGPRDAEPIVNFLQRPAISADGHVVAFVSGADNLVPNDYNGSVDMFVRIVGG